MIKFKKHSGIYTLSTEQRLNISLEEAWEFFSSPENLQSITPSHMGFQITSKINRQVYIGQIITYKIGILSGIMQNWVSEITQVKERELFIDEQRFGPYKMWHHEHWFYNLSDGSTLIEDKISYKIPFGFLGTIAQHVFIKKQLTDIFEFRFNKLESLFNGK